MKKPWAVKFFNAYLIIRILCLILLIAYAYYRIKNAPVGQFWIGFDSGFLDIAKSPDKTFYSAYDAGRFTFPLTISLLFLSLLLLFLHYKKLTAMRIAAFIEFIIVLVSGSFIPLAIIPLVFVFWPSVKKYCRKDIPKNEENNKSL